MSRPTTTDRTDDTDATRRIMDQQFRVWAPQADTVEVVVGPGAAARRQPLRRDEDGWWSGVPVPGPGTRYAFSVDGGPARPDPRSLSQPDGVHDPSEWVDLSAHRWGDQEWAGRELRGSVVYELHVGTFTPEGTLDAAARHLDHLVDLGVTTVELLPVAAFPGRHGWGYDGVCLYAVHAGYGGPAALQRFVDAAHGRGLAVCLDVVYNHLGPSGNYLSEFGPYFTDRHHTPWGQAVNLDGPGSDGVREFVLDNVRMWLEDFHLDALRLDAVHALHDERALHVLEEMAALADEVAERTGVPRSLIAESDRNDPATVAPRRQGGAGGTGLHGQWADDVHHGLHVALTGETAGYYSDFGTPGTLAKLLGRSPFLHDGAYSTFRGRVHGRPVDPAVTPPWRFVASLQTHDQVGNRAVGDRLCHQVTAGQAAAGAALLLTAPYTPMLFMGEEWAASTPWQFFTDHSEPELAEAIKAGRTREFAEHGWSGGVPDPQDEGTVGASRLRWEERDEQPHRTVLEWYRLLLRVRREHEQEVLDAPMDGSGVHHDEGAGTLRVERGRLVVLANLGEHPWWPSTDGTVLGSFGDVEQGEDGLHLPPHAVVVLRHDEGPEHG